MKQTFQNCLKINLKEKVYICNEAVYRMEFFLQIEY